MYSDAVRSAHIALGSGGFLLGIVALLVRKFGRTAVWHRWIGRLYNVSMIGMSLLSVPLSLASGSTFLLIIGLLTLTWIVGGWIAIWRYRAAQRAKKKVRANMLLRTHLILMGSSYIAAWTAFLVNVQPLGSGLLFWLYAFGPTVLGTILITRTSRHYALRGNASGLRGAT